MFHSSLDVCTSLLLCGRSSYWWFDHHNNDPVHVMIDQVVEEHIPTAVRLGPDSWVTADESGYAAYPLYNQCDTPNGTIYGRCPGPSDAVGSPTGRVFKAWESSCSIYRGCHPWFPYGSHGGSPHAVTPVMTLEDLMGKFESSWGRGTNMILNLPPEKNGLIAQNLVEAAETFAAERQRRFVTSVVGAVNGTIGAGDTAGLVVELSGVHTVDRLLLKETALMTLGQKVMRYSLEASSGNKNSSDNEGWTELSLNSNITGYCARMQYARCGGDTIGLRHVDVLSPPVQASRIRLKVLETIVKGDRVPLSLEVISTRSSHTAHTLKTDDLGPMFRF